MAKSERAVERVRIIYLSKLRTHTELYKLRHEPDTNQHTNPNYSDDLAIFLRLIHTHAQLAVLGYMCAIVYPVAVKPRCHETRLTGITNHGVTGVTNHGVTGVTNHGVTEYHEPRCHGVARTMASRAGTSLRGLGKGISEACISGTSSRS